jgi:plasmid stabilization system protein ParE
MNYTVIWVPSAEGQLAEIWMAAGDREAVTVASDRIERTLADAPTTAGESRPDGFRILIELPLVVYFQVIEDDRLVRVLRVVGSRTLM